MKTNIKLVQLPVITHKLHEVGKLVTERINKLNIDNLIAADDTVKFLKTLRADLNKELEYYEEARKGVKVAIANPYTEFEAVYKSEIFDKYKPAIEQLKSKIDEVEIKVKEEKKNNVQIYFNELCESENINFLILANVGLTFNLSTTEKAYKEKCNDFVLKVVDDISLIKTNEFEAEIMAEYKTNLNVSKSIKDVQDRKERERQERIRIEQAEWNRRVGKFRDIAMILHTITNVFEFNDEIYISADKVKDISKEEFETVIIGYEEKLKAYWIEKNKKTEPIISAPNKTKETVKKPIQVAKPIKEPKKEEVLEIVTASFEVKGTHPALKALGEYMKSNNITYKNI